MPHPPEILPTTRCVRRTLPFVSAASLALALVACGGDSTGPLRPGTTVHIAVDSIDGPILFEDVPGEPRIRCAVTFRATASGGESATWQTATFRFYAGPDRTAPLDSVRFSVEDVRDSWGGLILRSGQSVESNWVFESGAPFEVAADYRYVPGGGAPTSATAQVRVACGPEPSPSTPPPTITAVELLAPADGLEPGDTLRVSYTVNAPLGLWATAIELSGACEKFVEFGERLETTSSRTRPVVVPVGCAVNSPLTVTVHAADAALRLASRPFPGPVLVDHTPPSLTVAFFSPDGGSLSTNIGGIYFVKDSMDLVLWASDNHVVRWIVYEFLPSGLRDSISVVPNFDGRFKLPLPPEVTGNIQLRFYARDAQDLTSAPFTTLPDAIQVYPTIERPTLHTSFDGGVNDVVIDAERGRIYVPQLNERRIRVLSAATLEITQTIVVPYAVWTLDFTPSGDSLIVPHSGGLGIIDLSQPTPVLSTLPLTLDASVMQNPSRLVVMENDRAFVALGGNAPRANVLLEVNLATGDQRLRTDAADASGVAAASTIQRSPDRRAFVFNGGPDQFRRYDATTDQFIVAGSPPYPYSAGLSLDRGGQHNGLGLRVYDASLILLRRIESVYGAATSLFPATSVSADGEYLYVAGRRSIIRSRISDGMLVDRTLNPVLGTVVRVASDDSFLVTATGFYTTELSLIRMR